MTTLNQGQANLLMQHMNVTVEQIKIFKAAKNRTLLSRALAHYRKLNNQLSSFTPKLNTPCAS